MFAHALARVSYSMVKQRALHRPQVWSGVGFARLFSRSPKTRGCGAPEQTRKKDTRLSSAPPASPASASPGARTQAGPVVADGVAPGSARGCSCEPHPRVPAPPHPCDASRGRPSVDGTCITYGDIHQKSIAYGDVNICADFRRRYSPLEPLFSPPRYGLSGSAPAGLNGTEDTGPSRPVVGLGRVLINSVHIRFAPKATEILRCREITRWARKRHSPISYRWGSQLASQVKLSTAQRR